MKRLLRTPRKEVYTSVQNFPNLELVRWQNTFKMMWLWDYCKNKYSCIKIYQLLCGNNIVLTYYSEKLNVKIPELVMLMLVLYLYSGCRFLSHTKSSSFWSNIPVNSLLFKIIIYVLNKNDIKHFYTNYIILCKKVFILLLLST